MKRDLYNPRFEHQVSRRRILGVRVDDIGWDETLERLIGFIRSGSPHHVMTPNPEFVMIARRDTEFRTLLEQADLAPADGVGLKWAGALLGEPIQDIVPGSEIVERLGAQAMAQPQRWFLLGAAEGVAAAAGLELQRRYPGLVIAGTYSGTPLPAGDAETCQRIEAAKPVDVLLVAYGAPGQDKWIARNQPRLQIPVAIGVGGTLDLLAGKNPRPPQLIKRLHLIWLFRLITQPRRWRRQLALVHFSLLALRERWRRGRPYETGAGSM